MDLEIVRWVTWKHKRLPIGPDNKIIKLSEEEIKNIKEKNTLEKLRRLIGDDNINKLGQTLKMSDDLRYENGKLIRNTKVGERVEPDRAVRNAGNYKIFARHFNSNLPFTHYYIADTKTGEVFEIPEIITEWNSGTLQEITENIKNGGPPKPKQYDFDPLDWNII